ncbi:hypothetical protein C0992_012132 [Termitomyces sp. T32_za158]|nr:hypothetical protein C0992_012132 [Termitomyces sp. T32_za158]
MSNFVSRSTPAPDPDIISQIPNPRAPHKQPSHNPASALCPYTCTPALSPKKQLSPHERIQHNTTRTRVRLTRDVHAHASISCTSYTPARGRGGGEGSLCGANPHITSSGAAYASLPQHVDDGTFVTVTVTVTVNGGDGLCCACTPAASAFLGAVGGQ